MSALLKDFRFGVRVLAKNPGFSLIAVLVLGLGVGANTAVFSVVNALLFKPLPGADSGAALLGLFGKDTKRPDRYRAFSYPNYVDIREGVTSFSSIAAQDVAMAGLTEGDITRRSFVFSVSANYFETLGVSIARGRAFSRDEERPGSVSLTAVVSDAFWRKKGADPALVGKTVRINSRLFTVVGIAPPGFTGTSAAVAPEFWVPLGATAMVKNDFMSESDGAAPGSRAAHEMMLIGRLRSGVARETADRELAQVAARLAEAFPAENRDQTIVAAPLPRIGITTSPSDDKELVAVSVVLLSMSGVVLLVACLNLANMLLARGTGRRREIAIRLSLGASRAAVVRQLLVEGFILALCGGVLGVLLAYGATVAFIQSMVPLMPMPIDISTSPDWRVMVATLVFAALATMAFALGPAWRVTRPGVVGDLKELPSDPQGRRARIFGARNLLLGSQMALSLALLVAGALFVRGALKAADATPGFAFDRGLVAEIDPSLAAYSPTQSAAAHRGLLAHLRSVPGVEAVSMASLVPFGSISEGGRVERATGTDDVATAPQNRPLVEATTTIISADYFKSLGLDLARGRDFTREEAEGTSARRVAVIDAPLAERLFPARGENPIGQYIRVALRDPGRYEEPLEVVGVVPGLRDSLFDRSATPHLYVPFALKTRGWMNYHIRVAGGGAESALMLQTVRREIRAFDERLPVLALTTLRGFADRSVFLWVFRSAARIFTAFGLAALALALVGIYGVNAYLVARRTREIGIRMALGATAADVVRLVLREASFVAVAGIGIGLGLAVALGSVLSSMLYEVSPADPLALTVAPLLLGASALLASYIPARRAARIAPVTALRHD